MISEIIAEWKSNMSFETEIDGHKITVDASVDAGGENKGPRPKKLLLIAIAGCTGMDVISILKKMKVDISEFFIKVIGKSQEDHPKKYTELKLVYQFKGNNLELEKLKKAINLSLDKYCSVNAILKEAIKIEYVIEILN
jgi:putative redox protein